MRPMHEPMCPCPDCLKCCCRFVPDMPELECVNAEHGLCDCERACWDFDPLPLSDGDKEFIEAMEILRWLVILSF